MQKTKYEWVAAGDINAFFGLLLDNVAGLFLILSLLTGIFQFPTEFVVSHMIPGTAVGVFIGDLWFFFLAFWLARKTGRSDVTAMPLGLDTPSVFGITIFVLGPAYQLGLARGQSTLDAATFAWHIGIFCMVASGIFKLVCATFADVARRVIPRAGLLGSLTAIALVVISFLPLLDIMNVPAAGMVAMTIVLVSLLGQVPTPYKIPGSVLALVLSGVIFYVMKFAGWLPIDLPEVADVPLAPTDWLSALTFEWLGVAKDAINFLPIALPFAIATVVGGIDCTESAAAVGDHYKTNHVVGVEAVATIVAGLLGGVIQTTPYIGHPAYKAMGGRAAYTLGTAICMVLFGVLGFFTVFYAYVPKAAVFPLLIFVGLEITSQSFLATPKRHYPAVAFACVPALAYLSVFFAKQILDGTGTAISALGNPELRANLQTAILLSNGFIITALLWSSGLAFAIDRRLKSAGICFAIAAGLTMFGVIHSPKADNSLFLPISTDDVTSKWLLPSELASQTWGLFAGYALTAVVLFVWARFTKPVLLDDLEADGTHGHTLSV